MTYEVLSVADYFAVPGAHAVTTREQLLCLREVELSYECRGRAIRVQGRCPRRDQRGGIFELHLLASLRHLVSVYALGGCAYYSAQRPWS